MARVALLACVGRLTFGVCAVYGFLLQFLLASAFLTIAPLCNTLSGLLKCTKPETIDNRGSPQLQLLQEQ